MQSAGAASERVVMMRSMQVVRVVCVCGYLGVCVLDFQRCLVLVQAVLTVSCINSGLYVCVSYCPSLNWEVGTDVDMMYLLVIQRCQ